MANNRLFTRNHLVEVADRGGAWGFNRRLDSTRVRALPEGVMSPVVYSMVHAHRRGEHCELHMRCVVRILTPAPGGAHIVAVVDVPMEYYDRLPTAAASDR